MYVPTRIFLTKGVGRHREKLVSFEMALRDASLAPYNLVRVSSIFPAGCHQVPRDKGTSELTPGQIVHVVLSEAATDEPHRLAAASIGIAIPRDAKQFGYLSEHHSFGQKARAAGDYAEDLAAQMLATILGVEFDLEHSYDERQEIWRISGKFVKTHNITQTAVGEKNGAWTTVVSAAVLLP